MKRIPMSKAERVARECGYDQVVIYGRKFGSDLEEGGEYLTTYGVDGRHCETAARISKHLKTLGRWSA
jgi:hypothetical protein